MHRELAAAHTAPSAKVQAVSGDFQLGKLVAFTTDGAIALVQLKCKK